MKASGCCGNGHKWPVKTNKKKEVYFFQVGGHAFTPNWTGVNE